LPLQQGSGGLVFFCFRSKTGPIYCPDSMAPKRQADEVADVSSQLARRPIKRARRFSELLDQDVGKKSSALSRFKIRFKGPWDLPEVPDDFAQTSLTTIREALAKVLSSEWPAKTQKISMPLPQEKIYRVVRHLCDLNMEELLYDSIRMQCNQHIENQIRRAFELPTAGESLEYLVNSVHYNACEQSDIIGNLALYLDQTYCRRGNALPLVKMVFEILKASFKKALRQLVDCLWSILTQHRDGENQEQILSNFDHIFNVMDSFYLYWSIEDELCRRTELYYNEEANRIVGSAEVGEDYIKHVEKRCDEESGLLKFFKPSTMERMQTIVVQQLVESVIDNFGMTMKNSIENENKPLLRSLYSLFQKANVQRTLKDRLLEYTKNKAKEILTIENMKNYGHLQSLALMYNQTTSSSEQQHVAKIEDLISLRHRLARICEECFENDDMFTSAVNDGFHEILSGGTRDTLFARLLPEYLDNFMRSRPDTTTFEFQVNEAVLLLKHIEQLSLFVENYAHFLGKRLLFPTSMDDYSIERESFIITQLKQECSWEVISLERMLQDIIFRSDKLNANFKKFQENLLENRAEPSYNIQAVNATVLSQPEWPEFGKPSDTDVATPKEITEYEKNFGDFYDKEFDSVRDLHWPDHVGTWTLKAQFSGGEKEIVGTKLQVTILMQFNDAERLSLEEIIGRTRISNPTKILESLVRQNILVKESNGDNVSYAINDGFSSEHYRITVVDVVYETVLKEKKPCKLPPLQRYKKQVQAKIVSLMKKSEREGYTTQQLSMEVKVSPDFTESDFKACIEGLINSKHIKRSEKDPDVLEYIP